MVAETVPVLVGSGVVERVPVAVGASVGVCVGGGEPLAPGTGEGVAVGRGVTVGVAGGNWDTRGRSRKADESQAAVRKTRQSKRSNKGLGLFKAHSLLNGPYDEAIG